VPLKLQAKLLRVLETGELERVGSSSTRRVDVRVIAATNVDVTSEAAAGVSAGPAFSAEYHRNSFAAVARAQGRHRSARAPFSARYAQRYRKTISGFDPVAAQVLHEHPWPGNVRELDHAIERGVLLATDHWCAPVTRFARGRPGHGSALEK